MTNRNDQSGMQENPGAHEKQDTRDYYLRLFDDFPHPIWRAGLDARCDYFNRAWLAFTGRTLEQEKGDGWASGIHPEDLDHYVTAYRNAFLLRQPFEMEYRLRYNDGSYRWLLDSGQPFYDPDGTFAGYIGSCYDIDDRKRAEIALQEREKRYRELVENLSEVILSLDLKGNFQYISPVVERLYGYPPKDIIGKHFLQFVHPDDKAYIASVFGLELSGVYQTDEFRVLARDGSIHWVSVSPLPLEQNGSVIGFNFVMADITDRKKAEIEDRLTRERFETLVKIAEMQDAGERELSEFVMQAACRTTASTLSFMGWITPDERAMEVVYWSPSVMKNGNVSSLPLHFPIQKAGIWADAVRKRRPRIINDYSAAHPGKNGLPEGHVKISRFLSIPVLDNGKAVMIAVVANKPEPYDDADVTRLTLLMQGVWGHLQQRKAEQVLRESEEKFRLFFNNVNDAVYVHEVSFDGMPGRLIEVNDVLCQRLGYSREELLTMSVPDLLSENGRKLVRVMSGVIKKDGQAIFETEHLRKDGTVVPVEVSTHRFRQGPVVLSLANARDITDRIATARALKKSEEQYRFLVENIQDAVWKITPGLRFTFLNHAAERLTGYTPDELKGMLLTDTLLTQSSSGIAGEMLAQFKEEFSHTTTGTIAPFTIEFVRKDGSVGIAEVSASPVFDAEGHLSGFQGITRDVSERKKAEEAIKKSEALLNEMGRLAKIGGWELDVRTKGVVMTAETRRISDIPDDLSLDLEHALRFFDMPGRATLEAALQRCIESGEPFDLELLFTTASGRHIWTRSIGRDVKNDGKTGKITGTLQDITERKKSEVALEQINRKLNLLSSITRHDIRNQLLALKAYLELSLTQLNDPAQLEQYVTQEMKAANAIERQIEFTKEYQTLGINAPVWQSAASCVREAVPDLPVGTIAIREDLGTVEIYADPLLGKVFYNLIDNALRYGGPKMTTIRLSTKNSGTGITIVVEDDGAGIAAEDKKRLFERGFGHNTGLGLFLSREILSITNITIAETGEPGKGARFEIAVPEGGYRIGGAVPSG